jgi:hypothetical protein
VKKYKTLGYIFLGLISASLLFFKGDQMVKILPLPDPTQSYIESLPDPELRGLLRLILIRDEADFSKLMTMVRFRHSYSAKAIMILGYQHITADGKPPYDPLRLMSEQNTYTIFQILNSKMNFSAIGLEGMPPDTSNLINNQPKQTVLEYHLTKVSPDAIKRQIATASLFPLSANQDRADLQSTLIWQYGGKIKFISMETADFMTVYRKLYEMNQQGKGIIEIDKHLKGAVIAKRDQHFLDLINSFPEENIFIPLGAIHALDLCLQFGRKQPPKNIIIIFEPSSLAVIKMYRQQDVQKCLAFDQGPH